MTLLLMSSITAATAFPHRRSRSIALLAGAFAASLLLLWGVAGQGYTALPGYFSYSLEMLSGYASRRAAEAPAGGWHYLALPPLVLLIAATAMWRTRGWPPAALIGTWLITGVVLFAAFKQSFVRHAGGHPPFFFAAAIVLMIGLGLPRGPRRLPVAGAGALGVLLVTLVAVAHSGERRSELRESLQEIGPTRSLSDAAAQVGLLSSPGPAIAQTRKTLRAEYGVDVETVALLRGRGVHIWPDEATLAWAYPEMEWHPLPAFQTAVLYTPKLDRINTEALSTRRGPPFVLRERATRELDGPSTTMALFCHYTQIRSGARWQVLVRGRNRCRRSHRISSVNAISGRPVTVPRSPTARDIVIVRVRGLAPTPLARVQAFLYKGPTWRLAADGTSAGRGGAPFAPRTATGPLIVRVPASVNYPAPFELGVGADKISIVGHPPGARKPERSERRLRVPLTFDFYAVSITGPSVRRP